jgi:hypothetical protein
MGMQVNSYENPEMKLYFTCPETKEVFGSDHYALLENHSIVHTGERERSLQGMVTLTTGCPICGQKHLYKVEDIVCSLKSGDK